jgi:hypothetical protein
VLRAGTAAALLLLVTTTADAEEPTSITAVSGTVKIYARPSGRAELLGLLRPGQTVEVLAPAPKALGCAKGWFEVVPRGFVCATSQTSFDPDDPRALVGRALLPADAPYPYEYGEALGSKRMRGIAADGAEAGDDALLAELFRIGAVADKQAAFAGMKLAWARELTVGETTYVVTPDGLVLPRDKVKPARHVAARSALLDAGAALPFALALGAAPKLAADGSELGTWPLASLIPLGGAVTWRRLAPDRRLLATEGGDYVDRDDVSLFLARGRPSGVGADEKWVHVSINQGSLTAYEGDVPVFAAAVSPGMSGANPGGQHRTNPGRFRISSKHLTSDMSGPLVGGSYRTRAVPWVAYYDGGYALHGAWWHDRFGRPRSHGCINLTPADARWLFQWLEPELPRGWYAVRADATHPGTYLLVSP